MVVEKAITLTALHLAPYKPAPVPLFGDVSVPLRSLAVPFFFFFFTCIYSQRISSRQTKPGVRTAAPYHNNALPTYI